MAYIPDFEQLGISKGLNEYRKRLAAPPPPPATGMGDLRAAEAASPLVSGGELRAGRPSAGELIMSAFKKAPLVEAIVNLFHPSEKIAMPREPEELPVQPQGAKEWLFYGMGAALGEAPSIAAAYATGGAGAAGLLGKLAPKAPELAQLAARGAGAGLAHGTFRAAAERQPLPEALKTVGTETAAFAVGDPALSAAGKLLGRVATEAYQRLRSVSKPPVPITPLTASARPLLAPPAAPGEARVFRPVSWKPGPTAKPVPVATRETPRPAEPAPAGPVSTPPALGVTATPAKPPAITGAGGLSPALTRVIQRGKKGAVRVVFPDEGHALLFDLTSAVKKAAEGKISDIGPYVDRVRHLLKLPEDANVGALAAEYRNRVIGQASALEKGIIFRAPKFEEPKAEFPPPAEAPKPDIDTEIRRAYKEIEDEPVAKTGLEAGRGQDISANAIARKVAKNLNISLGEAKKAIAEHLAAHAGGLEESGIYVGSASAGVKGIPLTTGQKEALGRESIGSIRIGQPKVAPSGAALPEMGAEEIQQARSGLKEMDDALRVQQTDEGPVMLYSGIPAEKVADSVRAAGEKLADNLGIPHEKVTVVQPEAARQPGLLTPFKSPTRVALKYPQVKPYVEDGIKAVETQERLRSLFNKRLAAVDAHLGEPRLKDPLGKQYRENKSLLYEILLTEDALGKRLTPEELQKHFGAGEKVIKAHQLIRSAYDHAWAIANRTRELRGKAPIGYREGYVPHFFHNWLIIVNGQVAGSARTLREAVRTGNPLARQGAEIKIVPKQFDFPGADLQAAVIGDMSYFKMKTKVARDFGMSHADAAALLEGIVRMKGRSRFVGNFLHRKGTPGWEKDLDWVNRHYFNMISRYAALDGFKAKSITRFEREFGAFDKEHKGVAKYVKDYINDVNGIPTDVENLLNNTLEKVPVVRQFLGKYLGDRPSLQLAGATTNAVAITKLGLYNVSSALINATQLINTYAALGAEWTAKGLLKAARLNIKDKAILKRLGVDVQLGLESGAGYSKAGQMGQLFSKSTALFQATEKLMRRTAGLGAYYKALAEGRPAQEALDFAREIIRKTQFEYSIADAPAFIRRTGPVGQILFQFKKFPVKELEFITQLKGAEHARFWIPFALLSGYYAFPLAELLINTVKAMFGVDLELELKKHLMDWAGDDQEKQAAAMAIMYGAFSNLGVDISRRVGAGDFVPAQARDLPGPALSTVVNAAQLAARGNWIETVRAISPAPGNLLLALQTDGEISNPWERERLKAQLAPWERALKATGFMPAQESIQRDIKRVISYAEARRREEETAAIDKYIKSLAGPPEKKQAAVNRLIELQISPDRVWAEMQKKEMLPAERAAENVPLKRRAEYQNILEFGR